MLGGNADFLAKAELRHRQLSEELLAEADSYAETDDPNILSVREEYLFLLMQYRTEIVAEAEKVRNAGGLFIIGTERHESRRIDNQLRGRAGRQGDPGESRFYLSMEDDLMRLFANDRVRNMLDSLGMDEDMPIDAKILSNAVENAQKTVESRHFRSRKNVLEYDNVMNTQREVIYAQRQKVLDGEDLRENILSMLRGVLNGYGAEDLRRFEGIFYPAGSVTDDPDVEELYALALDRYQRKEAHLTPELMREVERVIMLRVVDEFWMDHIDAMDDLKQGIGLRSYGQHDPVIAYKEEGYQMFEAMIAAIREETVRRLFLVQVQPKQEVKRQRVAKEMATNAPADKTVKAQPIRKASKVGPNDPCPCGSGKKYKKCCMQKDKANS